MNILFIVAYPAAARVRPRELIQALARRGHQVTVATLWEKPADRAGLDRWQAQGIPVITARQSKARALWNCLRALPTDQPLQAHYSWNPALAHHLHSAVCHSPFDVVHVEHLRTARYGLFLKSAIRPPMRSPQSAICNLQSAIRPPMRSPQSAIRNPQSAIVWDSVDCISHLFEQSSRHGRGFFARVITRLELPRTRRYEGQLIGQFDRVLVTSPIDREALMRLCQEIRRPGARECGGQGDFLPRSPAPPLPITVLPNGVDLTYFAPQPVEREPETLVYVGRMSYHANVAAVTWFCQEVLPLIWAERPNVRFFIVGMDPGPAVRALGRDPRIIVTGTVPDVRPYLARATIGVAPIVYGAGTQFKILENMAMETAMVVTPNAAEPLGVQPGQDILTGDTPQAFAAAVLRLLSDPALRTQLGQAGRRYVEQHHDWNGIAAQLESLYQEAIHDRR